MLMPPARSTVLELFCTYRSLSRLYRVLDFGACHARLFQSQKVGGTEMS